MSNTAAARRLRPALREISRKDSTLTAHKIPKTERRKPGRFKKWKIRVCDLYALYLNQSGPGIRGYFTAAFCLLFAAYLQGLANLSQASCHI